jgi:hypothetical protein
MCLRQPQAVCAQAVLVSVSRHECEECHPVVVAIAVALGDGRVWLRRRLSCIRLRVLCMYMHPTRSGWGQGGKGLVIRDVLIDVETSVENHVVVAVVSLGISSCKSDPVSDIVVNPDG